MFHQKMQPLRQRVNVPFRDQKAGTARQHSFGQPALSGGDDRQTGCLRFLQRQSLAFLVPLHAHARQHEQVRLGH